MLLALAIRDLVLIDRVALELAPGLTILTGETGAGKSILLDGLGLALGERADASLVRAGAAQAVASATFAIAPSHPALALLAEQAIEPGDAIVVRRVVKADGGSRAFINDTPVSAATLKALTALLVEVHGQNDERGLLAPRGHLALLDAFGALDTGPVAAAWQAVSRLTADLAGALAQLETHARDRDWLEHSVQELAHLGPRLGEEAELADQRRRLQESARLAEALDAIDAHVSASEGALAHLRQAARRVERLAGADSGLAEALTLLDRMLTDGDALEAVLAKERQRALVSPEAVDAAEARLFELRAMARKHRVPADELPALAETLAGRLAALQSGESGVRALEDRLAAARAAHAAECRALGDARRSAAAQLDARVNAELPALKLDAARFRTHIEATEPGETGGDRVEFQVCTNPGSGFGPLTRIASGGEMSRFVLALKVALAATGSAETLVFDEIDRGVGGATATAIGERLARVASGAQVLVVTHSPQVAACGTAHFRIRKEGGTTRVTLLDNEERTEELARMLSGATITEEARAQARRLIATREGASPCSTAARC